ncbi:MAG: hypothetical protein WB384_21295 [Candidatus Sulfotelmatobacter sp.]
MPRPVVPDFGSATDALRGAAKADFGVSGWIEALSLGSPPEADEDGAILEFWALARQIKVAATVTNEKAVLHLIDEISRSAVLFPPSLLNYNTFSFKRLTQGSTIYFERRVLQVSAK